MLSWSRAVKRGVIFMTCERTYGIFPIDPDPYFLWLDLNSPKTIADPKHCITFKHILTLIYNPLSFSKHLWSMNQFDLVASDSISVDRRLADMRSEDCRRLDYPLEALPSTSVIVVFHNEAWSTLVRTVHSVINTSPQRLLHEIILGELIYS